MFGRFSNKTAEKYPDFIKATGYGTTEINNYKTFTKQKKSDIIEEWKE